MNYRIIYPDLNMPCHVTLAYNGLMVLCSQEKAAAFFQDLGCTTEWTGPEHDTLVAYNIQPAIITHPRVPSMQLWFNLVHLTVTYGDGSKVEDDVLDEINAARTAATKVLRLQAGDVLALDNYRCVFSLCMRLLWISRHIHGMA